MSKEQERCQCTHARLHHHWGAGQREFCMVDDCECKMFSAPSEPKERPDEFGAGASKHIVLLRGAQWQEYGKTLEARITELELDNAGYEEALAWERDKGQLADLQAKLDTMTQQWEKDVNYWKGEHGKLVDANGTIEDRLSASLELLREVEEDRQKLLGDGFLGDDISRKTDKFL